MNIDKDMKIAKDAALSAGHFLRTNLYKHKSSNNLGRDTKLAADLKAEQIILDALMSLSNYPAIAEESGWTGSVNADSLVWIVDPLDGTVNYSRDVNICSVSIALFKELEPVIGVIYDFYRDEMFAGIVGDGAELNGKTINVSSISKKSEAVIATGFPVNRDFNDESIRKYLEIINTYKKVRLFGSAAISLAYVACGRIEAYFEEDIMLWDVAAGIAIAKAAGAIVRMKTNNSKMLTLTVQVSNKGCYFDNNI